jgi:hypothetical protein
MGIFSSPLQYELWADLALQNKHLRRNNWFHWAVHLVLVVILVALANKPLLAVRIDRLGRAELVQSLAPANAPSSEEAEHVARLFSKYLLEVSSGSVARDVGNAMALMTRDFKRAYTEKVREDATLAALEKGNIRTTLAFDDQATELKAETDKDGRPTRYFVKLVGTVSVFRADVYTAPLVTKRAVIRTTLLAVQRTKQTLNGLLVDFFEKEYMDAPESGRTVVVNPLPASARTSGTDR